MTQAEEPRCESVAQASVFAVTRDLSDEVEGGWEERLEGGGREGEEEVEDGTEQLHETQQVRVAVLQNLTNHLQHVPYAFKIKSRSFTHLQDRLAVILLNLLINWIER